MVLPVIKIVVALIIITQQMNNETTSAVIRHLNSDEEFKECSSKYLSFIAPVIHQDTKQFFDISLINNQVKGKMLNIKPYNIQEFVEVTNKKENFSDMEKYTKKVFEIFKSRLN